MRSARAGPETWGDSTRVTVVAAWHLDRLRARFARLARVVARDPTTPEAVHDLRVATRRLRTLFSVFRPWLPRREERFAMRREVTRLTRRLGAVRDEEVLEEAVREVPFSNWQGAWENERAERREEALARLLKALQPERIERLTKAWERLSKDWRSEKSDAIRPWVPAIVMSALAPVRAWIEPTIPESLDDLHECRIRCKHLRYALEYLESFLGPEGRALLDFVRRLQTNLGDLQDLRATTALVRQFCARHGGAGPLKTLGGWLDEREQRMERLRQETIVLVRDLASGSWKAAVLEQLGPIRVPDQTPCEDTG